MFIAAKPTGSVGHVQVDNTLALKPKSRLIRAAEIILDRELTRYEIAIRQWALQDAGAARTGKNVNRLRLDFVGNALSELGFKGEDLEMRTMLFVCYHNWESPLSREISRKRRRDQIAKRIEFTDEQVIYPDKSPAPVQQSTGEGQTRYGSALS